MALLDILVGTEPNDGTGDDLRTGAQKVNTNSTTIQNFTGGAQYVDGTYTVGSPLVITEGTRVKLTCDNSVVIDGNLPSDFSFGMWDATTNKLLAVNDKDRFILEVRFKAKNSVINGYFDVEIDIGGTQNVINGESKLFTKAANVEQLFKLNFVYFTGSTFIANGGDIYIDAVNGNVSIYDIQLVPTRIHKGR
tara:strand:+ start:609 stop:1187 length:579 start_codon:yes stop_codon:yes gene_type:complete